jgi:hypothetical protein
MNVLMAKHREGGEHQDAHPRSEVTAVDADKKLEDHCRGKPHGPVVFRREIQHPLHPVLHREEQRREQNQEGNEPVEQVGGRNAEQHRSRYRARDTRGDQPVHLRRCVPQLASISPHGAEGTRPDRRRVRGVGDDRRQAQPDQRWKTDKRAAESEGVDGACDEPDGEDGEVMDEIGRQN